ncbi:MalY/PatB family protein [Breznakia pachnodae]|uniref:cysteine-S-conjugate beta-lyase n=1 Tax=Breznakia pachnodae TaxID=265178 RepID=A0ABU0E1X1_9FIRM|nr:PatB family C-S lyase [Breznakia pachnodae]MDQ0360888.1 cystathionine beta-lyase [Breznakia pachnodae]
MNFDEVNNRLGTYCTQWDFIEDRFQEKDLLPFSISDTDFKVPPQIINRLEQLVQHGIFGYTRWNHEDFKSSITNYFQRRFDTKLEADWILYSPSVMYSVSVLLRLLSKEKAVIGTFSPMYDAFFHVIEDNNRILKEFHLIKNNNRFVIDEEQLENEIKECDIFLLCSPHNPTGRVWTVKELTKIIELCKQYNVKIISDEIHMDMVFQNHTHTPIMKFYKEYKELYLVSSSSKTFNTPGLIGSYACIPDEAVREKFLQQTRRKDFLNSASIFGMHALMVGYQECDDYVDEMKTYIYKNMCFVKDYIDQNLPGFEFEIPDGTYLAWIDISKLEFSDEEVQEAFIKVGKVAIMSGKTYGKAGYLRLNCGCPKSKLEEGMHRVKIAMDSLHNI